MIEPNESQASVDLAAARRALAEQRGGTYWRSLNELAETDGFKELLENEFPQQAAVWDAGLSRRRFLQLTGASLALAGLAGCGYQKAENIIPYVDQPEQIIPGKPLYYASALSLGGYATGVLVESHMGRPTKIEGNLEHPASLGASDVWMQASILDLYDPDRSQVITNRGRIVTWDELRAELSRAMRAQRGIGGAGLRILTETIGSPTVQRQMRQLLAELPEARWHQYEPGHRDNAWTGAELAFDDTIDTYYRLENADVIVTLDADLLGELPGHVRYSKEFGRRRRVAIGAERMNRLYAIESTPTTTGAIADHRLPVRPQQVAAVALALANRLGVFGVPAVTVDDETAALVDGMASDLRSHRGRSVVIAGDSLPAEVIAVVHAINHQLGNQGKTVVHTKPHFESPGDQVASLDELARDMRDGRVDVLIIGGGNPLFNAPSDIDLAGAMDGVQLRVHLGSSEDETSALCHWHVPAAHALESWGDARAYDGTASIVQPLIRPLYDGRTMGDLIEAMLAEDELTSLASPLDLVRDTWRATHDGDDFGTFWAQSLHDGVIAGTAAVPRTVFPNRQAVARAASRAATDVATGGDRLTLNFRLDPSVHDGRFANNGWLQELPKPWSRLTWDNAVLMSPKTAESLGVASEDLVTLRAGERSLEAPVWILPGHAEGTATLHLGFGRSRAGHVAEGTGVDAYVLRTSANPWNVPVSIDKAGGTYRLACTQDHFSMEGRHLVRKADLEEFREHPDFPHKYEHHGPGDISMFPPHPYEGRAWGLAVDLGSCNGCNACVAACNAENNLPVVGKDQVLKGREMHWMRIDRYFEGDIDAPAIYQQPVMCQHCENAPCEQVCPVSATVHSAEGLNDMVYNRCVGTRYCSNNCPYKVRRFNFLQYQDYDSPSLHLMRNPDVTVRHRGVMEKCTFCVQRVNQARIEAKTEGRPVADGDVQTACQQACPTEALVFGDINDPASQVAQLKASSLNYSILAELNVKPRTTYLAGVRNPNPLLVGEQESEDDVHHG